jgi:hypothetical protein
MQFTLWGPKHNDAIVRIYIQGTDAYIWRKSIKHTLVISNADPYLTHEITLFLLEKNIKLDEIATRKDLARILYLSGLLTGNYRKYMRTLQSTNSFIQTNISRSVPEKSVKKTETRTKQQTTSSNVVSMADFKRRR